MRNKTLVVGCGRLGAAIAAEASVKGGNVVIVDKNAVSFDRLSDTFSGYKIVADLTDIAALEDLGPKDFKEAVISTGNDNLNLFIANVLEKVYEVPHIYVRFDDPDKSLLLKGYSNIMPIYPFELSHANYLKLKSEAAKK
ncbi:MAG: NAD-binding protein [Bacilli bacterium]|nr:NAD-binding protein [Bacilli bacterium]